MAQLALDPTAIVRGVGLVDQAYSAIRAAILSGTLAPGMRLSVPDLARQLDISRSPVREAIARIEYEGLARSSSHRGAVVVEIGLEELISIYEVREVLEGLAGRLAAKSVDEPLVQKLEENWHEHDEAVARGDVAAHMELDAGFHRLVRDAARNERLASSLRRLQGQIRVAMDTTVARRGGMHAALAEHRALIDAIRDGDPSRAERVSREHIIRLRESLHDAAVDHHGGTVDPPHADRPHLEERDRT